MKGGCAHCAIDHEEGRGDSAPLARMGVSALLFAAALAFGGRLRSTLGAAAEYAIYLAAYALVGYPVLRSAFLNILRGKVFDEMFLMSIASIGAIAIGQLPEAVGVMLFYSVGEYLQERAVEKSRRSIAELMDLRPEFARVVSGGAERLVEPTAVAVGDLVEVRPGERVPLDGEVVEGESFLDTSSLTGESAPLEVAPGQSVRAGYVNDTGRLLVRVTSPFGQSSVARILELVENSAARKAPAEKFMSRIAAVYTPFVVITASLIAIVPPIVVPGAAFSDWLYRALVLLVISCPCAFVISIPLGYFGGVGNASRHKILVKGADSLDALLAVDTVVVDKTGTLTKGSFEVTGVECAPDFSREEVLGWAAAAERFSPHPIAAAIRKAGSLAELPPAMEVEAPLSGESADGEPMGGEPMGGEPAERVLAAEVEAAKDAASVKEWKGKGVSASVGGRAIYAGTDAFLEELGVRIPALGEAEMGSATLVHVAVDGAYAGRIAVSDALKEGAADAVRALREAGVRRVVMLTGDREAAAAGVAAAVGVDEYASGLLPEDKVARLEAIKAALPAGRKVAFVGDGMNDAPVLMRADIGIAMGGLGSDAAIEAADVVIMDDKVERLPTALRIAALTRRIVMQNIVFSLGVKAAFLALGAFGEASMWEAVIADVGVALLAVVNAMRATRLDPGK
jgi:Cd2+/Zn2+-exporting ATPase